MQGENMEELLANLRGEITGCLAVPVADPDSLLASLPRE